MQITIAADTSYRPWPGLESDLSESLREQINRVVAPLWIADLQIADDAAARRMCLQPAENPQLQVTADDNSDNSIDKLLWLGVRASPLGYELTCREYDAYLRRWSPVQHRQASQTSFLTTSCFHLLLETFTPVALITPMAETEAQVQLSFKATGLPRPADDELFVRPGEAYQPLLRRTSRSGELLEENGVVPVPWTYLTTAVEEDSGWLADVHSGIRRPFGIQRGRVEALAVGLRRPPGPAKVRFHARSDPDQSLAGYEVFRDAAEGPPELIGLTDRNGAIAIPPQSDKPVSMILLHSEGRLLAKVPVPAGSGPLIDTPIADNAARLRAQAEAQVIREQLIDVVARRAIMMARVKAHLKDNRIEDARKLMMELDSLPTSSSFARSLDALEKRLPETKDQAVKRTIDRLFSSTREMMGKFLDRRQLLELQTQVNNAQPGGS